jgi:cytochrome c oxidase assembly protein subunit 11
MTDHPSGSQKALNRSKNRTAVLCAGVAAAMIGLAFASVPLYDLFCRTTGFGGTTMVSLKAPEKTFERTITIRFDSNVSPDLNWTFLPETPSISLKVGETAIVNYKVRNQGQTATTGVAAYNVYPDIAGQYFMKIQCFCFTDHTLKAGETMESQVVFYIDPAILGDKDARKLDQISLSYTYFPSKKQPLASSARTDGKEKRPL